jgi:hypothetical protein
MENSDHHKGEMPMLEASTKTEESHGFQNMNLCVCVCVCVCVCAGYVSDEYM